MPTSGSTYYIINKKSGTALELSDADQESIVGCGSNEGDNQKWKIIQHDDGWTFQNVYNGKYLDLLEAPENGVSVVAVDTSNPRKWNILPDEYGNDGWRIVVQGSNQNVDLADFGSAAPGTPVVIFGQWKGVNQVWEFRETLKRTERNQ